MIRETVDSIVACHGHTCSGMAMGIRAAEVALERRQLRIPCFDRALAETSRVPGATVRRTEA